VRTSGQRITEFNGVKLDVHRSSLSDGKFQADNGGDPKKKGSWSRRRGMRHTDIAKATNGIDTLLGFATADGVFALLVVDGANVNGFTGVAEQ